MEPCCVLQAFLDFVSFVGSEVPVAIFTGKPQLGVAKLRSYHELAKTRFIGFLCWLRVCESYRSSKGNRGIDYQLHSSSSRAFTSRFGLTTTAALRPIFEVDFGRDF